MNSLSLSVLLDNSGWNPSGTSNSLHLQIMRGRYNIISYFFLLFLGIAMVLELKMFSAFQKHVTQCHPLLVIHLSAFAIGHLFYQWFILLGEKINLTEERNGSEAIKQTAQWINTSAEEKKVESWIYGSWGWRGLLTVYMSIRLTDIEFLQCVYAVSVGHIYSN